MSEEGAPQTNSELEEAKSPSTPPSSRRTRRKRGEKSEESSSSSSRARGKKEQDKNESKEEEHISSKEHKELLQDIMKGIERRSKEMLNLEVRVRKLEKSLNDVDKNLNKRIMFIHNRGWKKKKK